MVKPKMEELKMYQERSNEKSMIKNRKWNKTGYKNI